jgi:hypothetical protein
MEDFNEGDKAKKLCPTRCDTLVHACGSPSWPEQHCDTETCTDQNKVVHKGTQKCVGSCGTPTWIQNSCVSNFCVDSANNLHQGILPDRNVCEPVSAANLCIGNTCKDPCGNEHRGTKLCFDDGEKNPVKAGECLPVPNQGICCPNWLRPLEPMAMSNLEFDAAACGVLPPSNGNPIKLEPNIEAIVGVITLVTPSGKAKPAANMAEAMGQKITIEVAEGLRNKVNDLVKKYGVEKVGQCRGAVCIKGVDFAELGVEYSDNMVYSFETTGSNGQRHAVNVVRDGTRLLVSDWGETFYSTEASLIRNLESRLPPGEKIINVKDFTLRTFWEAMNSTPMNSMEGTLAEEVYNAFLRGIQ